MSRPNPRAIAAAALLALTLSASSPASARIWGWDGDSPTVDRGQGSAIEWVLKIVHRIKSAWQADGGALSPGG